MLGDSPYGPSDHASFYAAGVPVLFFHTGGHDDYHAPGDTADKINAAGMAEVARLGLRIAERLGGEARPAYVALARPDGASRGGSGRGGDSGGAFLGVSVDGRSESDGVRLGSVIAGSGAERAGLRGGDVIVRMGDHGLSRFEDLRRALADRRPGDAVTLVYLRDGRGAAGECHPRHPPLNRGRAEGPSEKPAGVAVRAPAVPAIFYRSGRKNARMSAASASGSSSAAKWPPAGMGVQRVML